MIISETVIVKNGLISFIHEYERLILSLRCDVVNDAINMKFADDLSISDVKLNISKFDVKFEYFEI